MNDGVKSAVRVLEVLEFLGRSIKPASLKDVIGELGYPKSSAHALLSTLVSRGYAVRDEADRYSLNAAYKNSPGWLTGPDARLIELATPVMRDLRDLCGETVMLGVLNRNLRLKVIANCIGTNPVRYASPLSGSVPSYCTAMGRVLLAAHSTAERERYLASERIIKYTNFTVIDRLTLKRLIDEAGETGYAISDQEMDLGGSGVAAPVRDGSGSVVAALDVAAVSGRFQFHREEIIGQVRDHAQVLSRRLGWSGQEAAG